MEYTEGVITGITFIRVQEISNIPLSFLLSLVLSLRGLERVLETLSKVLEIPPRVRAQFLQVITTVSLDTSLELIQKMGRLVSESGVTFSIHGGWLEWV